MVSHIKSQTEKFRFIKIKLSVQVKIKQKKNKKIETPLNVTRVGGYNLSWQPIPKPTNCSMEVSDYVVLGPPLFLYGIINHHRYLKKIKQKSSRNGSATNIFIFILAKECLRKTMEMKYFPIRIFRKRERLLKKRKEKKTIYQNKILTILSP